jgi:oligopeptidase A
VRFFRVEDRDGALLAQFYVDLYAREGKRGGAWMDDARARHKRRDGGVQTPVVYLTCNFSAPVGGKPACFTHDEVITLFHEFGHGLHHMLTRVDELGVSGINGVEWDAVELPSQFMENFCWEWDVLTDMTAHVDTGAPLPRELFDKMLAAKNFQSGLGMLRQIVFSIYDMRLHTDFDPDGETSANALAREVNERYHLIPQASFSRWPNTFSHVFAGGYAAGYYSYKWAEVLSADAYSAFEDAAQAGRGSVLDENTGARYRNEILAVGGSRPAMDSFKAFRGRTPTIDALLRHNGMSGTAAH